MAYVIQRTVFYYAGTYNVPANGYLRRGYDGKPITFNSKTEALRYLNNHYGRMELFKGQNTYTYAGRYYMKHGEYALPQFTIKHI